MLLVLGLTKDSTKHIHKTPRKHDLWSKASCSNEVEKVFYMQEVQMSANCCAIQFIDKAIETNNNN